MPADGSVDQFYLDVVEDFQGKMGGNTAIGDCVCRFTRGGELVSKDPNLEKFLRAVQDDEGTAHSHMC